MRQKPFQSTPQALQPSTELSDSEGELCSVAFMAGLSGGHILAQHDVSRPTAFMPQVFTSLISY